MDSEALKENEGWKGKLAGSWQERKDVQLARDNKLVSFVNRYEVTTRELGCALLGLERTASNLKIVERRYHRLAKDKFHQIMQDGITYYVTLTIPQSKAERAQLAHRYMAARRSSTFLRCVNATQYLSGRELWARGGHVIPDSFFRFDTFGLFLEDETGESDFSNISPKCALYYGQRDLLKQRYGIKYFQVIWNCKLANWVPQVAKAVQALPEEASGMFFINHEAAIDPFRPMSILDRIYLSPQDGQYHGLLEE